MSSQGAPIAVNKVEVEMLPFSDNSVKPQFTISIQNVGDGKVIDYGKSLSFCEGKIKDIKWDIVDVKATLSKEELVCKKGSIGLSDGMAEVVCMGSSISDDRGTYTAPLVIKLNYGYVSTSTKGVEILREGMI